MSARRHRLAQLYCQRDAHFAILRAYPWAIEGSIAFEAEGWNPKRAQPMKPR